MFAWFNCLLPWSEKAARNRILAGSPPNGMRIKGLLALANCQTLQCLPARLDAVGVDVSGCASLLELPKHLRCEVLLLRRTSIDTLPAGLRVSRRIDATDCRRLRTLPALQVAQLNLQGCTALEHLPEGLVARQLSISGCPRITSLPASMLRSVERLDVSHCESLAELPDNFARLQTLDVRGCGKLTELPDGIRIRSWIDVAGSSLRSLPWSLRSVRILWRGLPVSDRIAFDPESITAQEILDEANLTMRSLLLDRLGIESFVKQARAVVVDVDRDPGGERRLLRIPFENGDHVVCVQVKCPSTAKRYFLRVPPGITTCHAAAAWIAGFINPSDYLPAVET